MTSRNADADEADTEQDGTQPAVVRRRTVAAVTATGAAVALLGACVLGNGAGGAAQRARPATVERLAAAAGCAPAIEPARDGLREATCSTTRGSYVMATFPSGDGMRDWVAASRTSGRSTLVGPRWAVAAPASALRPVQRRIGGRVTGG